MNRLDETFDRAFDHVAVGGDVGARCGEAVALNFHTQVAYRNDLRQAGLTRQWRRRGGDVSCVQNTGGDTGNAFRVETGRHQREVLQLRADMPGNYNRSVMRRRVETGDTDFFALELL